MQSTPDIKFTRLSAYTVAGTTTITTSSFDMQGYDGFAVLSCFETADATNIAKLQSSGDNSTFADLAGTHAGDGTHGNILIEVDKPLDRYHKAVFTRAVSTVLGEIWLMQFKADSKPVTNGTGFATVQLVSPAQGTA